MFFFSLLKDFWFMEKLVYWEKWGLSRKLKKKDTDKCPFKSISPSYLFLTNLIILITGKYEKIIYMQFFESNM